MNFEHWTSIRIPNLQSDIWKVNLLFKLSELDLTLKISMKGSWIVTPNFQIFLGSYECLKIMDINCQKHLWPLYMLENHVKVKVSYHVGKSSWYGQWSNDLAHPNWLCILRKNSFQKCETLRCCNLKTRCSKVQNIVIAMRGHGDLHE